MAPKEDAWTIGILFSRTGLMEIPSAQHVCGATLAISEINAASGYSAVRLFAATLERAGEMDTQRMMQCARGLEMEAPHGRIVIDLDNNHTWMTPRVGVWNGMDEFDVVWESDQIVQPDPWLVSYGGVEDLPQ